MDRTRGALMGALILIFCMAAVSASASSNVRVGLGASFTHIDVTHDIVVPTFQLDFESFALEMGAALHTGEKFTNFDLQTGFCVRPFEARSAKVGFGGQFNVETDVFAANQKSTGIGLGGFVEAAFEVGPHLVIALRGFPFTYSHAKETDRVGIGGVGFACTYFF